MTLKLRRHYTFSLVLLFTAICLIALAFGVTSSSQAVSRNGDEQDAAAVTTSQEKTTAPSEPADVAAFRQSVGGEITPVIIELRDEPGVVRKAAAEREGRQMQFKEIADYGLQLYAKQNNFRSSLVGRGVRVLMREADVKQIDGSVRHIEYRFTYLLNGFVAYVATEDIARLRALPEVTHVEQVQPMRFHLDKAIDYILGTQSSPAARRTAVYGTAKEVEVSGKQFQPQGAPGHPEAPQEPNQKVDGFEGQGMNIAVIDTGVDWRHPMFGGTGQTTPTPRVSGQAPSTADNKKVIYYYALSSPGDITDDFGHGTHVASCAAGYGVDGSTPRRVGYGTGTDDPATGLPGTGIGPTPNGVQLFGTAPQARIMAYKVCGPANACTGDSELAMEDAASPFTLVASGDTGPTPVAKPVADVINLSLGDEQGDPAGASARAANNAALAGTIVVASAGNSGPGAGTTGAPAAATLAISVAATLDPGSTPAGDVLAPGQIPLETCAGKPPTSCAVPGPPPEEGAASNANAPQPGERQGIRMFPVAGGASLPEGSLSAHYVFVDDPNTTPTQVRNRIALVLGGTGTFFNIVNAVAAQMPAAIIITDDRESLTALVVAGEIPVFNVNTETATYLVNRISNTDSDGNGDGMDDVAVGTVSQFPLRLADSVTLATFSPGMAGFSSRGPNDFDTRFRTVKPDIAAPGVGITGAATPDGLPSETVGMATPIGYITVNGTSFSGPITAGAMAVVRQRVREELGLDSTTTTAVNYRTKRFDTVTVARALLQNAATNLRSGLGVPQGNGAASSASINDMGAGLVNLDGALKAKAIMVAPTTLLPDEFTPQPAASPAPSPTPMTVLLPTASFGTVPVVGVNATVTRTHQVIIRDLPVSGGDGTYNLSFQNNRLADHPGFKISFLAANGTTPISSVSVPANGQATFFVKVVADGNLIVADPSEFQWYVTATHAATGQKLRMPFYYRAVRALIPNITSPDQQAPTGTEQPAPSPSPNCPVDTNGNYTIHWTYTKPSGGPAPVGFRVQEATQSTEVFFDDADEPLVAGENSKWINATTPPQWTTQVNPDTGSPAYFVPDTSDQNEPLTMKDPIALPAGGASLSFYSLEETEEGFDFAHVDIATSDDNFLNYSTIASFSGSFSGTRLLDLS
ncbi:MAG TPA: S8 family serine peptidase, partial [Pyrinomonadaceae bacterium]|nr:S8 family serine peptidase [Pyrinomonadaceae bacterium]